MHDMTELTTCSSTTNRRDAPVASSTSLGRLASSSAPVRRDAAHLNVGIILLCLLPVDLSLPGVKLAALENVYSFFF